jgi:hypothetical protein
MSDADVRVEKQQSGLQGGIMRGKEIEKMRRGIDALRQAQPIGRDVYWRGADVVTTRNPIPENPDAFYPPDRQFITRHAGEATWLFESLRDLLAPLIDFRSKFEFYERLAAAGERHQEWKEMRDAILNEAARWMDEMLGDRERELRDTNIQ